MCQGWNVSLSEQNEDGWNPSDPGLAGDFKGPPRVGISGHGEPGGVSMREFDRRLTEWLDKRGGLHKGMNRRRKGK